MSLDVVQGCYLSSSLPKALYVPGPTKSRKNATGPKRSGCSYLYFAPKGRGVRGARQEGAVVPAEVAAVAGREHLSIQTDLYLEELCDIIDEADFQCQTDAALDRPASPFLFVPAKTGTDVETQIYPGELFDFDREVSPLLEALVGDTLEQALVEVMAEDEMATVMQEQRKYEARKNAEVMELKRQEERERRELEEKTRRLKEQEDAIKLEEEVAEQIAACLFSQNYLSELVPQVYKRLEEQGLLEKSKTKEAEKEFWPWLVDEVDSEIASIEASCLFLDTLVEGVVQDMASAAKICPTSGSSTSSSTTDVEAESAAGDQGAE